MSCLIIKTTDDKLMTSLIDWLNRQKCEKDSTTLYSYDEETVKKIRAKIELAYSHLKPLEEGVDYETMSDIYRDAFDILDEALDKAIKMLDGTLEERIREKFAIPTDCTLFTFIDGDKVHFKVFASAHLDTVIMSGVFSKDSL